MNKKEFLNSPKNPASSEDPENSNNPQHPDGIPSDEIYERYRIKRRMSNRDIPILIIVMLVGMLIAHQTKVTFLFGLCLIIIIAMLMVRFLVWRCPSCNQSLFFHFSYIDSCPKCRIEFYPHK